MIQAIFFDFNGVIIDDERLQMEAYKEVLRQHNIELAAADYYSALGLDDKGFVITGADGSHLLATNREGIFAVGDVRCGSVKRVAAAVGEGSTVVSAIHAFLARQRAVQDQKAAAE